MTSTIISSSLQPHLHRTIAFTTPNNYSSRLSHLISLRNPHWTPLWCPTVLVHTTPLTRSSLSLFLCPPSDALSLQHFSAIAFTSRTGITAFAETLLSLNLHDPPLPQDGDVFTLSALGSDSELLNPNLISKLCHNPNRIRILVPETSTPSGLVESLGPGLGRRVLCPVPEVKGLTEPPVVPNFIRELGLKGWVAVRVPAYETRWVGPGCAGPVLERREGERLDAIVFTSSTEVEGLLKSLRELGLDWAGFRRMWPDLVVAAHGPVTAKGAERLGVSVDLVSERFSSFDGVVEALAKAL
ncbi:Tetrapyrrole biosynthesis, uroporphyrinogen III synthase [Dillenia turbinata]|uniref:Tetrapyrrole biosynthesis, uroporphyrinogen III synthase n=1 Tax=Dillenia turbinata TaxID=194707 RepID=A0AAN8Z863_9MAGN